MTKPRMDAGNPRVNDTLAERLASAAAQAIRKSHTLTGSIPARARAEAVRVTFDDGRRATYRVSLELVKEPHP